MNNKRNMMVVLLMTVICMARVIYVQAGEVNSVSIRDNSNWSESAGDASDSDWEETFAGTGSLDVIHEEQVLFRQANEDAIVTAAVMSNQLILSEADYEILTRIVEAEAGGLNQKSRILVANVILNRMRNEEFPDTVKGVVFQRVNGATQFSPVSDGRYYTVRVTESTKECVDRALAGEDYSEGALYFMERTMSDPKSVQWFDTSLTKLFKYEAHEFYR